MTVRDMIDGYRVRLLASKDMTGDEASQILVELSALVGNVNDEILDREMAYTRLLNELMDTPDITAAKAKIRAQASEEYEAMRRAQGYMTLVTEMARAIKYRLRALEEEQRLSNNQ